MKENEGLSYGTHYKKFPAALVQCQAPGCNKHLRHIFQYDCIMNFNISRSSAELKQCCDYLTKESGKEERSEDASASSAPLSVKTDVMINPDSLEYYNQTYERSQYVSTSSLILSVESGTMINPDSPENSNETRPGKKKRQRDNTQPAHAYLNRNRKKTTNKFSRIGKGVSGKVQRCSLIHVLIGKE